VDSLPSAAQPPYRRAARAEAGGRRIVASEISYPAAKRVVTRPTLELVFRQEDAAMEATESETTPARTPGAAVAAAAIDASAIERFVEAKWDQDIVDQLVEYIRIPNKSPMFDADWASHGYMDAAVRLMESWARAQPIPGMTVEVVRLDGRTPLIFLDIPASDPRSGEDCVLLYGHLDKQPEMTGWDDGLGPWEPVLKGDRLYGRGGADDGYAIFGSLAAIQALQDQGAAHARCVVLIEACEESGSADLPAYVDHLADRIGKPSLVVCLDSGCGNYDQLWCTTSLRGLAGGNLTIKVLEEGVHSGDASGIVPSSFRLLRQLLSRIEDASTGRILLDSLHVDVPADRLEQARKVAGVLGTEVYDKFPLLPGMTPMFDARKDLSDLVLNRTWRPALSVTGVDGIPPLASAGNVLRPYTSVKLSLRLPPTLDGKRAGETLKEQLERDPPNGAQVTLDLEKASSGWNAPATVPWLEQAIDTASTEFFGKPAMYMGEGGTIPFMGMLGEKFPGAQFMITGVLGPHSNAHGPNEFLHIPMGKRVTSCVARVIADHHAASVRGETTGVAAVAGGAQHGAHGCC
jgi:acetylornithine deacetylase/succinyl-diaminopimelate desuccinylase-like protein